MHIPVIKFFFDSSLIRKIKLQENGFNFCPEITAQFSKIKRGYT